MILIGVKQMPDPNSKIKKDGRPQICMRVAKSRIRLPFVRFEITRDSTVMDEAYLGDDARGGMYVTINRAVLVCARLGSWARTICM